VSPIHITDHEGEAVSLLPHQHKEKLLTEAWLRVLVRPFQRIENVTWQVLTEMDLETAIGAQLDILGRVVGEARAGKADEDYRRFIRARIRVNRSSGTINELVKIIRLMLGDETVPLVVAPGYPAGLTISIGGFTITEGMANDLIRLLRKAVSAGVKFVLTYWPTSTEGFLFTTAIAAFTSGSLSGGETTINVVSTTGFPTSGSLKIDEGLAVAETVTYSGKTSTSFTGVSAVANAHASGACVTWTASPGLGLGNSSDPAVGGQLIGARE